MSVLKNLIVIHCSASDDPDHDNIATMKQWHLDRGFRDVGYNYFIRKSGLIELGRDEDDVGAHTKGYNARSIGICLHGLKKEKFTIAQFDACADLIKDIRKRHEILDVIGHRVLADKTCPVFNLVDEIYPRLYEARFKR